MANPVPAELRRMDPGTLWPFVWAYENHLTALGYAPQTVARRLISACHVTVWLAQSRIVPTEIDDGIVGQFLHHRCQCFASRPVGYMSAVTVRAVIRFLRFLAEKDVVPASALPMPFPPRPIDDRISEFLDWLRHHRGIAESTIGTYRYKLERLLPALGADPTVYDASLVRRVILEEAERHPSSIKLMTTPLRSYLKFLVMRGACQPGIEYAVPTIARWRLSTLPRYLPPAAIEKLIASCDLTARAGIRDRAILLLLARLGLRAGDILMMRLGDIDWEAGTLTVCGKGRREIRLPLPQDAGDALLVYLTERRPTVDCDRMFLRSQAPYRPFRDNCGIARVVEMALERAGITDAPSRGAHLLRHSAATAWLRNGATLDAIGVVLRHQSVETTTLYAKVDIPTLQKVAQPWQGELPC